MAMFRVHQQRADATVGLEMPQQIRTILQLLIKHQTTRSCVIHVCGSHSTGRGPAVSRKHFHRRPRDRGVTR